MGVVCLVPYHIIFNVAVRFLIYYILLSILHKKLNNKKPTILLQVERIAKSSLANYINTCNFRRM